MTKEPIAEKDILRKLQHYLTHRKNHLQGRINHLSYENGRGKSLTKIYTAKVTALNARQDELDRVEEWLALIQEVEA